MNKEGSSVLLLIVLWCCGYVEVWAKEHATVKKDSVFQSITIRPHWGIVIPHHANMVYFIDDFSAGGEITYSFENFSKKGWGQYFNYPEVGIGLFYNTFGNKEVFGQGLSLYPYIQSNIFRGRRFSLRNKVALGIGYVNKPYDRENNPMNHIFGSHFNAYVGLGFYARYKLSPHWSINANVSLNHLSNGAYTKPNHGINTLTGGLGFGYHFNKEFCPSLPKAKAPQSRDQELLIVASAGKSQATFYNPNKYFSGSINVNYLWYRSKKVAWGLGLDAIHYGAAPYIYLEDPMDSEGDDNFFGGAYTSYNLFMGRTTIFIQIGAYLLKSIEPPQPVYPRVGLRYNINKHLVANFGIKASFFRAEFLEFGIGYRIKTRKS
jgi:hypothetical protein